MADRNLVAFTGKDLQDVTVGSDNRYPYTYPFDYAVEGLRFWEDTDKRTLSDPEA